MTTPAPPPPHTRPAADPTADATTAKNRREQLVAEVREWEQLAAECGDASPKARLDILKGLQSKRAELHAHDAAQRIKALDVERAARERSAMALSAGSHVAALGHARQAEQERLAREERERQTREQALARETPDSALLVLAERLRALPAGQLRRLLDAVCPALHLAPGVPCVACGRPTPDPAGEAAPSPGAGPGATVVAVAPAVVPAVALQDATGPRGRPQTTQGTSGAAGAPVVAQAPAGGVVGAGGASAPTARRVIGAPRGDR